jgi:hypothetical protein
MKRAGICLLLPLTCWLSSLGCKIEHTRTVTEEPGGRTSTEHSVQLKETVSGKEKGVEVYKSRSEKDRP